MSSVRWFPEKVATDQYFSESVAVFNSGMLYLRKMT